jgi:hypothetical protein
LASSPHTNSSLTGLTSPYVFSPKAPSPSPPGFFSTGISASSSGFCSIGGVSASSPAVGSYILTLPVINASSLTYGGPSGNTVALVADGSTQGGVGGAGGGGVMGGAAAIIPPSALPPSAVGPGGEMVVTASPHFPTSFGGCCSSPPMLFAQNFLTGYLLDLLCIICICIYISGFKVVVYFFYRCCCYCWHCGCYYTQVPRPLSSPSSHP